MLLEPGRGPHHLLDAFDEARLGRHVETPARQLLEGGAVGGERHLGVQVDELVGQEGQGARGTDRRVLLAQRSGGGVARIGEDLGPGRALGGVELLEVSLGEVDLAANLQAPARAGQLVGHVGDGAHVVGDVFAHPAVAARGRLHETTVTVGDRQGQPVDLGLDREDRRGVAEGLDHPVAPGAQFLDVKDVVEAQHRLGVAHRREHRRGRRADAVALLAGELGVAAFDLAQLAHQGVVVGVGQHRRVVHEVGLGVAGDLLAQLGGARGGRAHGATSAAPSTTRGSSRR